MALKPCPIQLEDLLRRDPVATDLASLATHVTGHAVLITGAGGSIGSELCRQLLQLEPSKLVMVERGDTRQSGSATCLVRTAASCPCSLSRSSRVGPSRSPTPTCGGYFLTIPEAVELVLQASIMGEGGDIFVLDMGDQIKIVDMAHDLIRLSGEQEGVDIDIHFVGLRPGEKMYEELGLGTEQMSPTGHAKVFRWTGQAGEVRPDVLDAGIDGFDLAHVHERLGDLVPEFTCGNGNGTGMNGKAAGASTPVFAGEQTSTA